MERYRLATITTRPLGPPRYKMVYLLCPASHVWIKANSADPDQMPQGLHPLHLGISIKSKNKIKAVHQTPLNEKWTRPINEAGIVR